MNKVYDICRQVLPEKLQKPLVGTWRAVKMPVLKCCFILHTKYILRRIKKKKKNRKQIQVLFLIQFPEMWNSEKTLYQDLLNDNRFIPTILCVPKYKELNNSGNQYYNTNDAYDYFESQGVRTINAYEDGKWFNIQELKPDYIFLQRPYNHQLPILYRFDELYKIGLLCYIPYSGRLTKGIHLNIEFSASFLNYFYMFFADCHDSYSYVLNYVKENHFENYKKVYNIGFPRFDLIRQLSNNNDSCKQKRFLWLPRWTLDEKTDKSNFLEYIQPMLQYFDIHPEYSLIIRPHPLMFTNFIKEKAVSEEEVSQIYDRVDQMENVRFDSDPDYLHAFEETDILISDGTSLLLEFFVTLKPIIFCGDHRDLTSEGLLINQTFYKAKSFQEITDAIQKIINDDPMKIVRLNNYSHLPAFSENAAENIKQVLMDSQLDD